jgi:hypothetical protein
MGIVRGVFYAFVFLYVKSYVSMESSSPDVFFPSESLLSYHSTSLSAFFTGDSCSTSMVQMSSHASHPLRVAMLFASSVMQLRTFSHVVLILLIGTGVLGQGGTLTVVAAAVTMTMMQFLAHVKRERQCWTMTMNQEMTTIPIIHGTVQLQAGLVVRMEME